MSDEKLTVFHTLKDKLIIEANIELLTGMHIGASNDFSPIGAVDSIVVKDPLTGMPIIPGSSIKGKLRTMMAKLITDGNRLPDHKDDNIKILELFGSSNKGNIKEAKLQFYDLFMINGDELLTKNLDLGYTEIKFENSIDRMNADANPRQLERVPKGAKFKFKLIYNLFKEDKDYENDFELISNAIKAIQLDYIGGSGTRGYGRVSFDSFTINKADLNNQEAIDIGKLLEILKTSEKFVDKLKKSNNK